MTTTATGVLQFYCSEKISQKEPVENKLLDLICQICPAER